MIFKLNINYAVSYDSLKDELLKMGIEILSIANDKKGYWIVFSNDLNLTNFKSRLAEYSGIQKGHKYPVFNVIDSIEDIPIDGKN